MKKIIMLACIIAGSVCSFAQTGNYAAGTNAGNTSGSYNTSVGYDAGNIITSNNGSYFGYQAGGSVTSGNGSFFGYQAGKSNSGIDNSFFGYQSGMVATGDGNTFFGYKSGVANTSGAHNVFIGYESGLLTTTGIHNTFIGYRAGRNTTTGSDNVLIGYNAGYYETGSNKLYIDNTNVVIPLIYGNFATNQVGINSIPNTTHALTVGGTIYTSGLFVNGVQAAAWNQVSGNISYQGGNVSIGTTDAQGYKLAVAGKMVAEEINVKLQSAWPDYVFGSNYKLKPLDELHSFINLHKHLPGVPSAREIEEKGISVGEMNKIMIEKIEELTLYVIELEKKINQLKADAK